MEKEFLVSVCIPSYNHAKYIQDCIRSVIRQDYENIELIIIDDGSTDGSTNLINELEAECRLRFKRFEIRSRANKGLCATLNEGLCWANGHFFSPIASDDILLAHKTSYLVERQKETKATVVFGSLQIIDANNKVIGHKVKEGEHTFNEMFFLDNMPQAPANLMLSSEIIDIGGFAEDVKLEDLYMWLTLTDKGKKLVSFPKVVVQYRDHAFNTVKDEKKMHEARLAVLGKFRDNPLYADAMRNASLVAARSTSRYEIIYPLLRIFEYKKLDRRLMFVLLKIITPHMVINLIKKIVK